MTVGLMLLLFACFLLLGMPIGYCMGLAAVLALAWEGQIPLVLLPQRVFGSLDNFSLLAVPLFILAGELMGVAGITARLVAVSRAAIGHLRGGLAQANILSNMFMAALSGSALADLAAIGSMMIPAMRREGYRPEFAVAVTACAAMMAPIIPPSIIAVIYGSITGVSIGALFLAGAVPGMLAGLAMMVIARLLAVRAGARPLPPAPFAELRRAALHAGPAMVMPVLILGGILSGAFTPTEAGAVAAGYALLYGLAMRSHSFETLYGNLARAASVTAVALITLGGASLFAWVLSRHGIGQTALRLLVGLSDDPRVLLLVIVLFFFVIGTFLEVLPALVTVVPIMQPIIGHLGFDPVHFGVVAIMSLTVGSVTPPVGILAMVACQIAGIKYHRAFAMLMPFLCAWAAVVLATAFVPPLATFLPSFIR